MPGRTSAPGLLLVSFSAESDPWPKAGGEAPGLLLGSQQPGKGSQDSGGGLWGEVLGRDNGIILLLVQTFRGILLRTVSQTPGCRRQF